MIRAPKHNMILPAFNKLRPFLIAAQVWRKDVTDGRRRLPGDGDQPHTGFLQRAPAFHVIALRTRGDHVFPRLCAAQPAREDVIHGEIAFVFSAILAGEIIPAEQFTPG